MVAGSTWRRSAMMAQLMSGQESGEVGVGDGRGVKERTKDIKLQRVMERQGGRSKF